MIRNGIEKILAELKTPLVLVTMRVGGAVAAFILSLLMARTMDPAEMGVAMTCLSAAPLATLLVTGSTEAGCLRFLVAYREKNEISKLRGMVSFNRRVTLVLGSTVIVFTIAWLWISDRESGDLSTIILLTAITAVLLSWQKIASAHVMSLGHVVLAMAPYSFWRQVLLVLCIGLWLLTDNPLTKEVVASGMLLSVIAVLMLQVSLNHRPMQRVIADKSHVADYSDYREWTKVGLQLGMTLLFVQFSRDLTLVFSSLSLSPEDIGVLGIATAIGGFAKFYVVAINQSIGPKLSEAVARNEIDKIMKKITITNHLKFWPMVLVFIVFWLFGDEIARIFGPEYERIAVLLPIIALEPLAMAFFGPGGHLLSMSGHQFVMLPLSVATIAVLACAITIGAHLGGVEGAAYGSSVAWLFWTLSLALFAHKYVRHDVSMFSVTSLFFRR